MSHARWFFSHEYFFQFRNQEVCTMKILLKWKRIKNVFFSFLSWQRFRFQWMYTLLFYVCVQEMCFLGWLRTTYNFWTYHHTSHSNFLLNEYQNLVDMTFARISTASYNLILLWAENIQITCYRNLLSLPSTDPTVSTSLFRSTQRFMWQPVNHKIKYAAQWHRNYVNSPECM